MSNCETLWLKDQKENGWILPPPAASWKRLVIIRHIRAAILRWKVERHYAYGPGLIGLRSGYDDWVLYAIQRGWC